MSFCGLLTALRKEPSVRVQRIIKFQGSVSLDAVKRCLLKTKSKPQNYSLKRSGEVLGREPLIIINAVSIFLFFLTTKPTNYSLVCSRKGVISARAWLCLLRCNHVGERCCLSSFFTLHIYQTSLFGLGFQKEISV